jgi:hypothetical protein
VPQHPQNLHFPHRRFAHLGRRRANHRKEGARARERSSGRGQGYQPQAFKHPSSQPQGHRTRYARASESTSSVLSIRASLKG